MILGRQSVDKLKEDGKYIGYCRVSTENQKEEGTIEIQEKEIEKYSETNNLELLKIFKDEGVSGSKEPAERLGWLELIKELDRKPNIEGIIIYRLDRLARDLRIQENIIHDLHLIRKKRLISIKEADLDSTDFSRVMLRQILGSFAEYEKNLITNRLKVGRFNKAKKGEKAGGSIPFGYKNKGNKLVIDVNQKRTVRYIFYLKNTKKMSLVRIAGDLNRKQIPTARGGKWYAGTIKYMLENSIYKGFLEYKGIKVKRTDLTVI
jgi:site-specific DNA recombinase